MEYFILEQYGARRFCKSALGIFPGAIHSERFLLRQAFPDPPGTDRHWRRMSIEIPKAAVRSVRRGQYELALAGLQDVAGRQRLQIGVPERVLGKLGSPPFQPSPPPPPNEKGPAPISGSKAEGSNGTGIRETSEPEWASEVSTDGTNLEGASAPQGVRAPQARRTSAPKGREVRTSPDPIALRASGMQPTGSGPDGVRAYAEGPMTEDAPAQPKRGISSPCRPCRPCRQGRRREPQTWVPSSRPRWLRW
jgi:hypothetical protein